ncbi:ABC transporter permease subunit [Gorillibacterium sp. sgz500922]|uniref:ABC transporter permease subunit n=1 Tax=Gorillibacterium sp. sgz500922 TaxID=3446694 RepID=UPI003F67A1A3
MTIFWREMRASRKGLILWCVGVFFLMIAGMNKFQMLKGGGQATSELLDKMPKSLQVIFGTNGFDLSTGSGYYGAMFFYVLLMGAVHASLLGAALVAKEERDRTSEFLLAKPVSREAVMAGKLAAGAAQTLLFTLASWLSSALGMALYAKEEALGGRIALLMLGMLLVQFVFLAAGACFAAVGRRPKRAVSLSSGAMLATFLLSLLVDLSGRIGALRALTPFQYVDAHRVLSGGGLSVWPLALAAVLILLLTLAAFRGYRRRDIGV